MSEIMLKFDLVRLLRVKLIGDTYIEYCSDSMLCQMFKVSKEVRITLYGILAQRIRLIPSISKLEWRLSELNEVDKFDTEKIPLYHIFHFYNNQPRLMFKVGDVDIYVHCYMAFEDPVGEYNKIVQGKLKNLFPTWHRFTPVRMAHGNRELMCESLPIEFFKDIKYVRIGINQIRDETSTTHSVVEMYDTGYTRTVCGDLKNIKFLMTYFSLYVIPFLTIRGADVSRFIIKK